MASYPIYIGKKKQDEFIELVSQIGNDNKSTNQGTSYINEEITTKILELIKGITNLSWNHYDCDGKIAFTIRFRNTFADTIQIDGEIYKGVVFGAPYGHLSKYYSLR